MDLTPGPSQLDLGNLIARLQVEPDQSRRVRVGFRNPHSYRGYYEQLGFELARDVTVGEMLAAARGARGATFQGWKGGDYMMDVDSEVWLVAREGGVGETLGVVLLELMLDDSAFRAGREAVARALEEKIVAGMPMPGGGGRPTAKALREWAAAIARGEPNQPRTLQGDVTEDSSTGTEAGCSATLAKSVCSRSPLGHCCVQPADHVDRHVCQCGAKFVIVHGQNGVITHG